MISSCFVVGWMAYGVCFFSPTTLLPKAPEHTTQGTTTSPDELSAKEILERMAAVYASCTTYRDSGEVNTVFKHKDKDKDWPSTKKFTTVFVRPKQFRFEYSHDSSGTIRHYVIARKDGQVRTWHGAKAVKLKNPAQKSESLKAAIGAASGVSSQSAFTIPALLLPDELAGRNLTTLKEVKRLKDARLGNREFFQIQGVFGGTRTLWIDKETFLVCKMVDEGSITDRGTTLQTERTTTYDPVINEDVPPRLLEFRPQEDDVDEEDDE